jgi:hypothetical protein
LAPGHPDLPEDLRPFGQPVLVGGTMGTASYVLVGTEAGMARAFGSACHGAGRSQSRHAARKQWRGRDIIEGLAARGILVRSHSLAGIAEEAPGAYKDVETVVAATEAARLARKGGAARTAHLHQGANQTTAKGAPVFEGIDARRSPLLTDLYQLNMLEAYLAEGLTQTAVFELFFSQAAGATAFPRRRRSGAGGRVVADVAL